MTPPRPGEVVRFVLRNSKRVAVTIVGSVLVLGGLVLLVLPGPGLVVVALGFAVLGTEYMWAARALERTKSTGQRAAGGAWRVARSVGRRRDPSG